MAFSAVFSGAYPGAMYAALYSVFSVLMLAAPLQATDPDDRVPEVSMQVERNEITVGDRIRLQIEAVGPSGYRAELPSVLGNLGVFESRDIRMLPVRDSAGWVFQTWELDVTTFMVGEQVIPGQTVVVRSEDGSGADTQVLQTQPITIEVKRTVADTAQDIADIAPLFPVFPGLPPWIWLLPLLGLLLGSLAWVIRKRKSGSGSAGAMIRPPYEEARLALDALRRLELTDQGRHREFCFELSAILRRYITRRFGVDALESTTSEFLSKARGLPITPSQLGGLEAFCQETDPVKFANQALAPGLGQSLLDRVSLFLDQTRPTEGDGEGRSNPSKSNASINTSPSPEANPSANRSTNRSANTATADSSGDGQGSPS